MERHLLMSRKELARKSVLELVKLAQISLVEASFRMRLSYRQTLRVYQRFVHEGDAGLVHLSRGKPSGRRYRSRFRTKVIERYRTRYARHKLGPTLAAEKLAEDGIVVDHETLHRWLLAKGLRRKRRKCRVHRCR